MATTEYVLDSLTEMDRFVRLMAAAARAGAWGRRRAALKQGQSPTAVR